MNKRINGKPFLHALMTAALFAALSGAAFLLAVCVTGTAQGNQKEPMAQAAPAYWTGAGAKGLGLAVLVPEGRGMAEGEAYLPTMVQGVIVGDFTKFSAMKVLDRQNLDKVIAEGESGFYENESNFVQLGTVANVRYILNGALQKTGSGFSLQLKVTDAASGESKAVYTGNATAAELENLTGIKKASADLLSQLGVTLTDAGKTALLGAAGSNAAAETALAKGITAQRSGTVVEALSYYYEAAKFDPGLAEAASRNAVLTSSVTSGSLGRGNLGQNVRNEIERYKNEQQADMEWRTSWNKTLTEAAAFFKEHPPFEIIYDPALTQGKIDYARETVDLSFIAALIPSIGFKIIYDLDQGLEKTDRKWKWELSVDSIYNAIPSEYKFDAALINENGETIGRTSGGFSPNSNEYHDNYYYNNDNERRYFPLLERENRYGFDYDFSGIGGLATFEDVDANKITDKLTVSIVSINGMGPKTAGERGYISISTEDFAALQKEFKVGWRLGGIEIAKYTGSSKTVVIPEKIGRWPVVSIGGRSGPALDAAFYGKGLTSVTIPNSVTFIGDYAFYGNRLTRVTIPNSVTSIGDMAFTNRELTRVTLPANVQLDRYSLPCAVAYYENGQKAGTYTRNVISDRWKYRPPK